MGKKTSNIINFKKRKRVNKRLTLPRSTPRIPNSLKIFKSTVILLVLGAGLFWFYGAPDVDADGLVRVRAIDGDTFEYQGKKLRLLNVDTPEPSAFGNAECAEEAALGDKASRFSKSMVRQHRVEIIWTGQKDRFGRDLVRLKVEGRDLSRMLIEEGLGRWISGRQVDWCR